MEKLPLGPKLFSKLLGHWVPYSGTVGAEILELKPGHSLVQLDDRRGVRNHLSSIHAMALANLGELATGLAVITALPPNSRSILVRFSVDYLKKARGRLTAECKCGKIDSSERRELLVSGRILNSEGQEVATVQATWLIGPK